jgi:hypothetical protein
MGAAPGIGAARRFVGPTILGTALGGGGDGVPSRRGQPRARAARAHVLPPRLADRRAALRQVARSRVARGAGMRGPRGEFVEQAAREFSEHGIEPERVGNTWRSPGPDPVRRLFAVDLLPSAVSGIAR